MYKPFDLTGHGSVITGGNGGIGYGMARALLASGASVAIWGSRPEKTENARAALAKECGDAKRVHAFVCDVGDEAQVESSFAASVAALGRVDSCFANAGIGGKGKTVLDMTLEEFRRIQRINVEGVFLTFRAAARCAGTTCCSRPRPCCTWSPLPSTRRSAPRRGRARPFAGCSATASQRRRT